MKQPLISIIMPNYNAGSFIKASIESVITQTYDNWELWIIDDASTDTSLESINSFVKLDSRIQRIVLPENKGPAIARNKGIEKCNGEFIAFLDSDDRWIPRKLEKQLEFMVRHNYVVSFTSYVSITEDGKSSKFIKAKEKVTYSDLLTNNYIGCLTAMYHVKTLGKIYFPKIKKRQDWAMWLKITKNNINAYGLEDSLGIYTKRKVSVSSNKLKLFRYNWIVYRRFEKINCLKSIYLIFILIFKKIVK
ncbi:glycosyltransferase family 2 protein [Lutibacter holmesii]|uniref:Glycosyltransferase family 2 protein n=1 Tax=Lutibacter holmesii TaxID=1137985 RepID=A0ABW3WPP7_9FLAO